MGRSLDPARVMVNPATAPDPPEEAPPGSWVLDLLAAALILLMMSATGAGVFGAVRCAILRQTLMLTDRWGANPVPVRAASPLWWIMLASCAGGFAYCGYLLFQLVRKRP
jgi:hypothetical protein